MISHIDHIVLTVSDIDASVEFYTRVLQMEAITMNNGRRALRFGNQKINLQTLGQEPRNKAGVGSGDVCLISNWSMNEIVKHLTVQNIEINEGPVMRSGAVGPIQSVYFLDPDRNLIEVSVYSE
ncbi:biphenyl-2,3-diol 1,2-dioxygenase III-related protein [Vibrio ishigakensis]|uniref:Biphenyl-2,3-diol 1,2-dioxygenase III-related protein n=1 Tax=Vibrio ishigakensis TaxID=1481914 RepID=A0A0B8NMR8_9VIBR|nr:VOC family protein [Vibrio ishigakensis]GAM55321.1 biphenyl-2,3-diol 1,2-dioxygenase III-related protein [Vibrio ishigakensis]